jgi:hypothetical protein
MKNVKIDEKSKFYTTVFLMVVLCGVAFFLGYRKFEEKKAALDVDSSNLEARISELEQYYLTEDQNKADTEKMIESMHDIFSAYQSDARSEDGIFEAYNLIRGSEQALELSTIGFESPAVVKEVPADVVAAAGIEEYQDAITFYNFDVTYEGKVTYEGLKGMIREIANGDYNLAIGQMKYAINPDGYIEGRSQLSFYYVDGAGLDYSQPPVVEYETGLQNLFGVSGAGWASSEDSEG